MRRVAPGLKDLGKPPIVISRWVMSVKYALFGVMAMAALTSGVPTLAAAEGREYVYIWAIGVGACSAVAAVSSTYLAWERAEKWAAVGLSALLITFLVITGIAVANSDNPLNTGWAGIILLLIVTLLPATRAWSLVLHPKEIK